MVRCFRHVRCLQRLVRCAELRRRRRRHGHIKLHRRRRGDCHFDLAAINACVNHVAAPRARRNRYGSRRRWWYCRRFVSEQNSRAAMSRRCSVVEGRADLCRSCPREGPIKSSISAIRSSPVHVHCLLGGTSLVYVSSRHGGSWVAKTPSTN